MINNAIFPAPKCSYHLGNNGRRTMVHMPRPDGMTFTVGYYIENPAAGPTEGKHLAIYAHPNAVDIGMMHAELEYFSRKTGCHVLLFEFRGYGLNGGRPGEEELNVDMEAAYNFATKQLQVPGERIILFGRSIGTGPSTQLASRLDGSAPHLTPPALLLLEAPFASIKECVKTLVQRYAGGVAGFASSLVANRFRTAKAIGRVKCHAVLVHGMKDDIVTYDHSEKILASASAAGKTNIKLHTISDCGHNDIPLGETIKACLDGLAAVSKATPAEPVLTRVNIVVPEQYVGSRSLARIAIEKKYFRRELFNRTLAAMSDGSADVFSALRTRQGVARALTLSSISFIHAAAFSYQQRDNRARWAFAKHLRENPPGLTTNLLHGTVNAVTTVGSIAAEAVTSKLTSSSSKNEKTIVESPSTPSVKIAPAWKSYTAEVSEQTHLEQCMAVWGSPFSLYALVPAFGSQEEQGLCPTPPHLMVFGCQPNTTSSGDEPPLSNVYDDILHEMRALHRETQGALVIDGGAEQTTTKKKTKHATPRIPLLEIEAPRGIAGKSKDGFLRELTKAMTMLLPAPEELSASPEDPATKNSLTATEVDWNNKESPTSLTSAALSVEMCDRLQLLCERYVASFDEENWSKIQTLMDQAGTSGLPLSDAVRSVLEDSTVDHSNKEQSAMDCAVLVSSAAATIHGVSADGEGVTDPAWKACVHAHKCIVKHGTPKKLKTTTTPPVEEPVALYMSCPLPPQLPLLIVPGSDDEDENEAAASSQGSTSGGGGGGSSTRRGGGGGSRTGQKTEDKDCCIS